MVEKFCPETDSKIRFWTALMKQLRYKTVEQETLSSS
jgi:hypothetical protein